MAERITNSVAPFGAYAHLLYRTDRKLAKKLDRADLLGTLKKAVRDAAAHLGLATSHLVVVADRFLTIPEEGVGGHAFGTAYIQLAVDPDHRKGTGFNIRRWLPSTVVHELHHLVRARTQGYGRTLGEALVSEGLACAFEEFVYRRHKAPYAHTLSALELKRAWAKANTQLGSSRYRHDEWFYGTGALKRWTGYSLGFSIVKSYLKSHPEETPASLVAMESSVLLKNYSR